MKQMISLLLSLALLLSLLSACRLPAAESEPPAPAAEMSCADLVSGVWGGLGISISDENSEYYGFEDLWEDDEHMRSPEEMAAYVEGAYGLGEDEWEEASIIREGGMSAVELSAVRFADEEAARHGEERLNEYLHSREGDFTGYNPGQAKLVSRAVVVREGLYVGLFIVEDSGYAGQVFREVLMTGEMPEPTPSPEPYRTDDINEVLESLLDYYAYIGGDISGLERIDGSEPDRLNSIIKEEYKLADYPVEDAVIVRGTGGSVFEIAILRLPEGRDGLEYCSALTQDYLDVKETEYARFPAQAQMLSEAIAANPVGTNIIILAVCGESSNVIMVAVGLLGANGFVSSQRHFDASKPVADPDPDYPGRTRFVDPGKEDMSIYDTAAICAAWEQGDPAGLSAGDRAVYDAAEKILGEIITDGMTDLEKETAIYDWLVNNVNYDWRHQDVMVETPRTSYQPYGGLVAREAVCLGYATSFQLLMDLADVECVTVTGACFNSGEHHAWNMVRLQDEWYCVDVTWDANYREQGVSSGREEDWNYFNVTSDEMGKNHQWDYSNTPEATAEDHGRS